VVNDIIVNDLFDIIDRLERVQKERMMLSEEIQDLTEEFEDLDALKLSIQNILVQIIFVSIRNRKSMEKTGEIPMQILESEYPSEEVVT